MRIPNRIFDDIAKVANGAVSTLSGIKAEIEAIVGQQIEKILVDKNLVIRDEFEVVKEVATEARLNQEQLEKRIMHLEAQLDSLNKKPAPRTKKNKKLAEN